MDESKIMTLVSQASLLMERFERRFQTMDAEMAQTRQALERITGAVPGIVQKSADDSLRAVPSQVMGHVKTGMERPLSEYETRLNHASKLLADGSEALANQLVETRRLHRALLWKVAGVTGGSLTALIIGAVWLATHYAGVIRQNQISAELLHAYNLADVTLCEGVLCANVDMKGSKYGEHGKYRLVKAR